MGRWIAAISALAWLAAGYGWLAGHRGIMWMGVVAGLVIAFALYPAKILADFEARRNRRQ